MKIGFVSDFNPYTDRKSWSGTVYKIREAIEMAGHEIVWIKFDKEFNDFTTKTKVKLLSWYMKLSKKNVIGTCYLDFFCKYFAKTIEKEGLYKQCDCLFFAGPSGGQIALYLKKKIPYIYLADANYHIMENYYWFNLSEYFAKKARKEEELATQGAWINIRSSQWAADGAIRDCHANKEKVFVLEFGANIDDKDVEISEPYHSGRINILFSGTEWERKGGQVAVDATKALREKGYDAILHIIGIKQLPASCQNLDYVNHVGFLNKNNEAEYRKYLEMWHSAHILLLPTRAECAGIVFSEAAAYGVPTFTYNTGGIGNYVIDGKNGYKLNLSEGANNFAEKIVSCIESQELEQLAKGARQLYEEKLSWKSWARRFKTIIENNSLPQEKNLM